MDRVFDADDHERERATRAISTALAAEPDIVFAYLHGSFLGGAGFRDVLGDLRAFAAAVASLL